MGYSHLLEATTLGAFSVDATQISNWQSVSFWVACIAAILLWGVLIRLHIAINREETAWGECTGKILSALLRKNNPAEELEELKVHSYTPIIDKLISIHFSENSSPGFDRWLLMESKIKEALLPYWHSLGALLVIFGIVIAFCQLFEQFSGIVAFYSGIFKCKYICIWLLYAGFLAIKLWQININLGLVQRALLLPQKSFTTPNPRG